MWRSSVPRSTWARACAARAGAHVGCAPGIHVLAAMVVPPATRRPRPQRLPRRLAGPSPPSPSSGAPNMHVMLDPFQVLNIVDYGDAPVDNMSTERTMEPVRAKVREIAATGTIPFIIGGDHSLEYANVAGLADVHGKGKIGVIHFDSHFDASPLRGAHLISHGQPVRRVVDEGHVLGKNYIQVGLRGYYP